MPSDLQIVQAPRFHREHPSTLHVNVKEVNVALKQFLESSLSGSLRACLPIQRDFVELYVGSARMSQAMVQKGFIVGPPVDVSSGWNLCDKNLFGLLMGLRLSGSIAILWMGHPRSTFTLDRRPRLRTIKSPWGVDVLQPQVLVENLHVHQCLALFMSQSCVGSFAFLETPWGAYTRKLPWWKAVSKHGFDIRLDQCRYGTAYLKPTGLLCNSKQFKVLGKRCRRDHVHTPFNSSSSGRTCHYPEELCLEFAQLCNCLATAQSTSNPSKADFSARVDSPKHNDPVDDSGLFESEVETVDLRDHRGAQRFVSHLWSTQLAESLPWKVARRYKFARTNHINVLECHVRKTLLHLAPMDCRLVNFQDSMVTLGATAKGRSSSAALNSILRQDMSLQLAKNVYVCGIHCPTWALRADDPSRQRQVRPARAQLPQWLLLLKSGSLNNAQDLLDACSDTPRSWGRWLLFCQAAFLAASGQYDSIGDWTQNALRPKRQKGLGQRPSHRGYCANQENVVASIRDLDSGRRHGCSTNSSFGPPRSHPPCEHPGGVWKSSVRTGSFSTNFCRNGQLCSTALPILEKLYGWTLEPPHHLGNYLARQGPSSITTTFDESVSLHSSCVGLDPDKPLNFDRLLRTVETMRAFGFEGERLSSNIRNRMRRCDIFETPISQIQNQGGSASECAPRCSVCSELPEEMSSDTDAERTHLEWLLSSV